MPLLDWLSGFIFGARRVSIEHNNPDAVELATLANDVNFIRDGSGSTIITGPVGHGVKITMYGHSSLTIRGNIGHDCRILKESSGTLTIEGMVEDDLKLTVNSRGAVTFVRQPPVYVTRSIKNQGNLATITCAGNTLSQPNSGYIHHNLGITSHMPIIATAPQPSVVRTPVREQPRLTTGQTTAVANDKHSEHTQRYIDKYWKNGRKTVKQRIEELALTESEEYLFDIEEFKDPTTLDYFDDIPVRFNGRYYNLLTLLNLYHTTKKDPFREDDITLNRIEDARDIEKLLDKTIVELRSKREVAKNTVLAKPDSEAEVVERPGLRA